MTRTLESKYQGMCFVCCGEYLNIGRKIYPAVKTLTDV